MPTLFLDSSALLKRYIDEAGSDWVRSMIQANVQRCYVARIAGAEVVSALCRLAAGKHVTQHTRDTSLAQFKRDFSAGYIAAEISKSLIESAMQLAERHTLRGYDAVQLAAGLAVIREAHTSGTESIFVCADATLNKAAKAEGLSVENPNDHG